MSDNEKTLALLAALVGVRASGPRKVQRPRMADEIRRLRADNTALTAAVQRVRALHYRTPSHDYDEDAFFCKECGADYPCPTLRALEVLP